MAGRRIAFPLLTERLVIRPMEIADAGQLAEVYGDARTMQHLTSDLPTDLDAARAWVQRKIDLYEADGQLSLWTVIHRETGLIVGDVGLQHEDYGHGPEVGIGGRGNRGFWRLGLGLEAATAALDAGFGQLGLERIGAETGPENLPAQRLLERLGMRRNGSNPAGWPVYVITRQEWDARASLATAAAP